MGITIKGIFKTTNWHRKWWKDRKLDWASAYGNPEHPHRMKIIEALKQFRFTSVLELGMGAGANLVLIKQHFPKVDVGGIDINAEAVEVARKVLPNAGVLQTGEATDVYLSNRGSDMILTDMCYIYLSLKDFKKAIKEAKRMARRGVVFCEFHEPRWWRRWLIKLATGYGAFDYRKALMKEGFHDIRITPLTPKDWPDTEEEKGLRAIIVARI